MEENATPKARCLRNRVLGEVCVGRTARADRRPQGDQAALSAHTSKSRGAQNSPREGHEPSIRRNNPCGPCERRGANRREV